MNFDNSQFVPNLSKDHSNLALSQVIANRIAETSQRRITFAEFMDLVLYHPEYGYYTTNAINLGKQGDFFTSVHLGADFGELLAVQFIQMWEILGRPGRFSIIEMGAGQGLLAFDILEFLQNHHADFFSALDYVIVEESPAFRQEQRQRLQGFPIRWCQLAEIPSQSITGCFFSNELVDALPVHQFILEQGQLQEVYVTTKQNLEVEFVEVCGEVSTPQLGEYFKLVKIEFNPKTYPDGYRSEVNLAALSWLSQVANALERGYVLTIDYGYSASRYYNPRRSQGTLQCYYQHRRHNNPYINIGQQDITTHVDFTALERWGEHCGLNNIGFTQQGLFLMMLGLGDRIAALSYSKQPLAEVLRRRDALHQLADPLGLGGFGVLVQTKDLTQTEAQQVLQGLRVPEKI
jgi:SAM-dependent MidA family methyltransferase